MQAHAPCSGDEQAHAFALASTLPLLGLTVVSLPLFGHRGAGNLIALTPQFVQARVPFTLPSRLMMDQALKSWAADPTTLPAPLFVDSGWGAGDPMVFEDFPNYVVLPPLGG
jgi:hypothetical protein